MPATYLCPWGCGEMVEVEDPFPTKVVTCPRCDRDCRLTKHEEPDGSIWFELTPHEP